MATERCVEQAIEAIESATSRYIKTINNFVAQSPERDRLLDMLHRLGDKAITTITQRSGGHHA